MGETLKCSHLKNKLLSSYSCYTVDWGRYKVSQTFDTLIEIRKCNIQINW